MNVEDRDETTKWLKLAYEAYGPEGVAAMAQAMGVPGQRLRALLERRDRRAGSQGGWTSTQSSDMNQEWREPVRPPAMCPASKPIGDPSWKPYRGISELFHCGFDGFLENRRPSPSQPIAECFYDEAGNLVDQNHPYAGCRGTPDQYPWNDLRHTTRDKGGVAEEGLGSAGESLRHQWDRFLDAVRTQPW